MKRRRIVDVMLLVAGAAVLVGGIGFRVADFHVQTVLSGSMRPTVQTTGASAVPLSSAVNASDRLSE